MTETSVSYRVLSADSHVVEPHDMWAAGVEAKYKDRAPRLVRDKATDRIICADAGQMPEIPLLAGCLRGDDEVRLDGRWDEDIFPGCYDPAFRIPELERDDIAGEVLYPTLGMCLYPIEDLALQRALFRAYNTWLAEAFCQPHPETFKGIAMIDHALGEAATVAEISRSKELGLAGFMVPLVPGDDVAPYHAPETDWLWAAAVDNAMPVSLHTVTSRDNKKAYYVGTITDSILSNTQAARVVIDMIMFGVFDRFPGLTVVSAENDAGWAGNVLERADYLWHRLKYIGGDAGAWCARAPSEYWRENVRVTFMRDQTAVRAADVIGAGTLMWGSDFPHHVSTWPNSRKVLAEHFDGRPGDLRKAIVHDNVRSVYWS